jgi:hypothetical protein
MEPTPEEMRRQAASILGKMGGPARAASLSPARRRSIARKAAEARWNRRIPEQAQTETKETPQKAKKPNV